MPIHYGMAQWQHPAWVNWLYSAALPGAERLAKYAQVFDCVELGSTFYTQVDAGQMQRWCDAVPERFKFSCKVPQLVTHRMAERAWADVMSDWLAFIDWLAPFEKKLGPTMLQLPRSCDESYLERVLSLCDAWHLSSSLSVEVRHLAYFDKTNVEANLLRELSHRGVDRVVMDSRPVFSTPANCESLVDAQQKKPRVPCHPVATARQPVVRYIGHPDLPLNEQWLQQWAKKLSQWLEEGREPTVFVHSSDNIAAPTLAAQLDAKVASSCEGYQAKLVLPEVQEQIGLW